MDTENLIKEMVYEFGVSGYEDPIKEKIVYYLKKYGQPKIDKIGNVYFTFGGNEKHIAFIAHMDEIGVIVTHIDKSGMLRIKRVGGVDSRMLYGQYLEFLGRDGKFRYGVIGLKPPHYALSPVSLGKGPVFRFFDARGANSLSLVKKLREIAERNGIKYQEVVTGGSTDAAGTFERGIPSVAISFPIKYTHSTVEMLDLNDIENEIKLMEKISEY